jgi:hypothetical protein
MSNAIDLNTRVVASGTFGNVNVEEATLALANGDAIASTHDILILPAGVRPVDCILYVTDVAAAASSTLDLGLKSVSGINQDDPLYFFQTQAITAAAIARKNRITVPFTLAQKMYLRATVRGAAQTDASTYTVVVFYRYVGNL